jgi:hypothetical protein
MNARSVISVKHRTSPLPDLSPTHGTQFVRGVTLLLRCQMRLTRATITDGSRLTA